MGQNDYPAFDAAVAHLQAFLTDQHWPTEIRWIRLSQDPSQVKVSHEAEARREYELAVERRLGVALEAIFVEDRRTHVAVTSPRDVEEQCRLMYCDGLKLSICTQRNPPRLLT